MAKRDILILPDPVLRQRSLPVEQVDGSVRALLDDMLDTMYAAPGVGLAAIQIGLAQRIVVIDVTREDEPRAPICLVNPEIVWTSEERAASEEGCLSIPDYYEEVERAARVKVRFLDRDGAEAEIEADGMLAVCLQHELDHLDGVLFIDRLSRLKRERVTRKFVKAAKRNGTERM